MGAAPSGLADVLKTWTPSPVADLLIAFAVVGYLVAARSYRHSHGCPWPILRTACWLMGAALVAACINSALAVYGRNLLWVHMIVHLLMIMVVPAFAVWAQPIRLLHSVASSRARRIAKSSGVRRISRWLIIPWITVPMYSVVLVGTHLTGFQQAMLQHMWLHSLELAVYLLTGYLLLLPIIGGELTALAVPPMLRFVILALCMGPDTLVGVVLMLTGAPLAPAYAAHRNWGPSALADQSAAGAIMWWGGDGIMMILMLVVAAQWVSSAPDSRGGLGKWLENIRQQTLLGTNTEIDVDDDAAALDAYNARLAALHGLPPSDAAPKNEGPARGT